MIALLVGYTRDMGLEEKSTGINRTKSSFQLRGAVEANVRQFVKGVRVEGKEHLAEVPEGKHLIIATTHISDLDVPLVIKSLGDDLDFAISNASTQHSLRRNFGETLGILAAGKHNFLPIDFAETGKRNSPLPFNPENYRVMADSLGSGKAVLVAAHTPSDGVLGRGGYAAVYLNQLSDAVILPVAVSLSGEAIMVRQKKTNEKTDAQVIIGKPLELPHIAGIEEFDALLRKRREGEVTDADRERFKELSSSLKQQSEMLMRALAELLPEEKRGPYKTPSTTGTSAG